MSNSDENIRTLINLGLTGAQAKIYLALLDTGPASIKEIAQASKVARPDTYRAILELQVVGIVEKIVIVPTKFKPLPIIDAVGILILRRTKESIDLNKRANKLIESLKEKTNIKSQSEDSHFVLIPAEALELELRKLVENSKDNISIMVSRKRLLQWITNEGQRVQKALERRVTVRIITEEVHESNESKEIQALRKFPNFEERYIVGPPTVWLRIYDDKEILLTTSTILGQTNCAAVFSNNPCLAELAQNYFNAAWFSAIEPQDQAFKHDRRQFDFLFANLTNGFSYNKMIFGADGKPIDFIIVEANSAFREIVRIRKNILGEKASKVLPGIAKNLIGLLDTYWPIISTGKSARLEYYYQDLKKWFSVLAYSPEKGYFAVIFEDITERKKAEDALRRSQHFVQKILDTTPTLIYIYDFMENRNVYSNREIVDFLGYSTEQINAMSSTLFSQILHPADAEAVAKHHAKLNKATESEQFELEYRMKHSDGKWRWLHSIDIPFSFNHDGTVKQILGSAEDITERKQTEQDLKDSLQRESFLADLIRNASIAIAVTYPDGRLMMGNKAFQKLTGYNEEELKSVTWNNVLTPPEWREHETKKLEEINRSKKSGIYRKEYLRKDGSRVPIEIVVHPFFDDKENISHYFGFIADITERKKVEDELLEKTRLNQIALDALPCVAVLLRPGTREIVASNKAAVRTGAVPGTKCFSTWGKRETPCPWCLAPILWESGKEQHLEIEALGVIWDAYWVPVSQDLYMHYAFDITERKKNKDCSA